MKLLHKLLVTLSTAVILMTPIAYANAAVTFPINGGTGSTTLSGILKGAGTSPIVTAIGGTDYEFPLTFSTGFNRTGNTITNTGVLSFNTRTGAVTLSSSDVTTALGYTPSSFSYPFPSNATTTNLTMTNGMTIGEGAALTYGGTNTGIIGTNTGGLRFEVGGGIKFRVDSNVEVGFDTTGASKFNVSGNTSLGSGYVSTAAPTDGLIVQGSTGIGTSTPGSLFSVGGNGTGTNFFDNATTSKSGVGGYNISSGCYAVNGTCITAGGGSVSSVSNSDGSLTISPTTGAVVASINLGHTNTFSALQVFLGGVLTSGIQNANLNAGTVNSTSGGVEYSTATSTPTAGTGIAYSGTLGDFTGGTSGTLTATLGTNITPNELNNAAAANSLVYTDSTGALFKSVATTSVSCSGSVSCTQFATIGGSPVTITGSGGGTGLSTSSPISSSNVLTYSSTGAGSAYGTATSSIGAGTGLTFSGTAGAQIGGTNGTYSVNTTQNILKISGLTTNGFVQTSGGDGTLSSAALTSGQVTTALGFTPTNYLTNVSANTFLNKGTNLQAPVLMATSTTATSTFAGDVSIGSAGELPNPYLFMGTSTSQLPIFGRVQGDLIDAEYDWNGQTSINVVNANIGSCASATFFADGNNPTLGGYYGTFSFLNDGWTGVNCGIGAGTAQKPEAVAIVNPTGEMDFVIASTTNNGSADFNWFSNTNTPLMKLTNQGRLALGTTSPTSLVDITSTTTTPTESLLSLRSNGTKVFDVSTSTQSQLAIGTSTPLGTNVLTTNGGVYLHGIATGAGNGAVCQTTDGQLLFDAGANCITSSLRFKNVDATITPEEGIDAIMQLSPITFHYKADFGDHGALQWDGFGAEDLAAATSSIVNNLVQYGADGKPYSIYYQNMVSPIVAAIHYIEGQIVTILSTLDSHQNEIDELKAQNVQMQKEINDLKANQQHYVKASS